MGLALKARHRVESPAKGVGSAPMHGFLLPQTTVVRNKSTRNVKEAPNEQYPKQTVELNKQTQLLRMKLPLRFYARRYIQQNCRICVAFCCEKKGKKKNPTSLTSSSTVKLKWEDGRSTAHKQVTKASAVPLVTYAPKHLTEQTLIE